MGVTASETRQGGSQKLLAEGTEWSLPEWLLKASLNDQTFSPTINMPLLFKGVFPFALTVAILLWYFKNHPSL